MLDRICVAYDEGAPSRAALSVAVQLAGRAGAALTLVHVADPQIDQPVTGEDRVGFDLLGFTDERRWQARLTAVAAQAGDRLAPEGGGEVEVRTVAGEPADELPELASATGADLIVAGAPRCGLRAVLTRSVSRALTRGATRPVLFAPGEAVRADGAVLV
ncbi:MAG: universal stress protein, partial [Solirubrobacteraceae bacterium]|nr:universal stress protein [Solirubrobacteraceae bacterium]